jgi:hypothetical protein
MGLSNSGRHWLSHAAMLHSQHSAEPATTQRGHAHYNVSASSRNTKWLQLCVRAQPCMQGSSDAACLRCTLGAVRNFHKVLAPTCPCLPICYADSRCTCWPQQAHLSVYTSHRAVAVMLHSTTPSYWYIATSATAIQLLQLNTA